MVLAIPWRRSFSDDTVTAHPVWEQEKATNSSADLCSIYVSIISILVFAVLNGFQKIRLLHSFQIVGQCVVLVILRHSFWCFSKVRVWQKTAFESSQIIFIWLLFTWRPDRWDHAKYQIFHYILWPRLAWRWEIDWRKWSTHNTTNQKASDTCNSNQSRVWCNMRCSCTCRYNHFEGDWKSTGQRRCFSTRRLFC